MTTETPDGQRERRLAEYDHTHDVNGHPIQIVGLQDGTMPGCDECGRSTTEEAPWGHALACSHYSPHPASIAAQV